MKKQEIKMTRGSRMGEELKQCPYCEATMCVMLDSCDGCETYSEYQRKIK